VEREQREPRSEEEEDAAQVATRAAAAILSLSPFPFVGFVTEMSTQEVKMYVRPLPKNVEGAYFVLLEPHAN
jgi:hypothetical protein